MFCIRLCHFCQFVIHMNRITNNVPRRIKRPVHEVFSTPKNISETFGLTRGGADKSLARPGRKQATATKLGIYSTHSPRSSIQFLARCCNFCKPLKKYSEGCPSNQVSATACITYSFYPNTYKRNPIFDKI